MSPKLIPREHLLVERTVTAVTKTQNVRLIDVFLLGPTMIWAGLMTIVYNGDNYLRTSENYEN